MRIPSLILSTIMLFLSNIIVRVLGFLYKIFLSRTIGESGLGIYHLLFSFLMICIALTTTGIPTALSFLTAKKYTLKDKHGCNVLFISTLYTSLFISFLISILIYINSKYLASVFLDNSNLNMFIIAICPAVITLTLSNVLRGYYYGIKNATIPAISQILEQGCRIIFVYLIISYINDENLNCYIALLGISIGEIVSISILLLFLYRDSYLFKNYSISINDFIESSLETLKISIPITCNRMSNVLLHYISSIIVPSRLVLSGIDHYKSLSIYGIISGMVMPLVYLPFTVVSALVVNLIPSLSQEIVLKNYTKLKLKINYSLFLTFLVGISFSILFYIFADNICMFLFNNKLSATYLKAMYLLPLFISLNQTLSAILHSIGKEVICSFVSIIAMIIQLIFINILVTISNLNIYGYIYTIISISILITLIYSLILILYLKTLNKKSYR